MAEIIKCDNCNTLLEKSWGNITDNVKHKAIKNPYWHCLFGSIHQSKTMLLIPEKRYDGDLGNYEIYIVEKEKNIENKDNKSGFYNYCLDCFKRES